MGLINEISLYAGIIFITIGSANLVKVNLRKKWPGTRGKITQSTVESEISTFHSVRSKQRPLNTYSFKSYKPILKYEYEVNGKKYEGHKVFSAPLTPTNVKDILFLTDGAEQTIWYQKRNPKKSYIVQSGYLPSILLLVLGLVFLGYSFNSEYLNDHIEKISRNLQNT